MSTRHVAVFDPDRYSRSDLLERRGEKWTRYGDDVLAAWVADMDFAVADPITRALQDAVARDDLGYASEARLQDVRRAFVARMAECFGWTISADDVIVTSDVVQGVATALMALSDPGDAVLVHTPVYPPLLTVVPQTGRRLVAKPLARRREGFGLDRRRLQRDLAESDARMIILCNPQNPTGRVLTTDELSAVAETAIEHDVTVLSDEIHQDLVYEGHHVPLASLGEEIAARTVTFSSPSKSFNIAGVCCAVAVFGDARRRALFEGVPKFVRGEIGILDIEAALAAWTGGDEWLRSALGHLRANRDRVGAWVERTPGVSWFRPEATYLAWFDCRETDLGPDPAAWFLEHARVALSSGTAFGRPGRGHVRLNFATPAAVLDEVLDRLGAALTGR